LILLYLCSALVLPTQRLDGATGIASGLVIGVVTGVTVIAVIAVFTVAAVTVTIFITTRKKKSRG